ncbi:NAD(P)H-hydrate dehydratase [Maribius pontilimi]|uniref:Bifunctional NAD(P)H-hydrate repair enzyme n=1 Tax=Palleronia pontilimi TaxID=1964209 RepID=A0A934IIA8_9RHOB|nr:NAD(P)H-hydrate dehydratase [Palleronia pontilimi]MBJ3763557.1 NAD(P)H-hydrate dehydratase [Palleronia pontilimi]
MRLLTAAEMREIEMAAMESGSMSGIELMERAGAGVVDAILEEWPELRHGRRRAVVLCGPGNNGGDGFVVARLLSGCRWDVEVRLLGDPESVTGDARANLDRWLRIDAIQPLDASYDGPVCGEGAADIVVDALFGIGLSRPLEGLETLAFNLEDFVDLSPDGLRPVGNFKWPIPKVVALDVPSSLCADSGKVFPHASGAASRFRAHLTVTFHKLKRGHVLGVGPELCGRVRIVDIGLADTDAGLPTLGPPARGAVAKVEGHKYDHGHAFVLSGGVGKGGAARMAARAALRVGAGLVTLGCEPAALTENAAQLNAIMLRAVTDATDLEQVLADMRITALGLGPGLGLTDHEAALLRVMLDAGRPTVLDADALSLIARDDDLRAQVHKRCVLTPHRGEFARLFPDISERLDAPAGEGATYSEIDAARDAASEIGATVLLKGPATVIATPTGRVAINAAVYGHAVPWLATAGAGDVLSGLIVGLLARDLSPFDAACDAAWLHAEAAHRFGAGLIAEDLPDLIPGVLASLGA